MKKAFSFFTNHFRLAKLDVYIMRQFLSTFFFGVGIFIAIVVVIDVSEKIDDFVKEAVPLKAILWSYYPGFILFFTSMLSPLIIFVSVVFFTAKMAVNTEIIAILSAGISYRRLMYPYLTVACLLSILVFLLNGYIIPPYTQKKMQFENKYINAGYEYDKENVSFRLDENSFACLGSYNHKNNTGKRFILDKFSPTNSLLLSRLMAEQITWNQKAQKWQALHYSIRYIDGLQECMEQADSLLLALNLHPTDFERKVEDTGTLTLPALSAKIDQELLRGTGGVNKYQMEWYRVALSPVTVFILIIIGVSLSSQKVRGGIGVSLGIGIALCFAYVLLIHFSTIFSIQGGLNPAISAWIPHGIFGSIAVMLYLKAPK